MFVKLFVMQLFKLMPYFQRMIDAKAQMMEAEAKGLMIIKDIEDKLNDLEKRTVTLTTKEIDTRLGKIENALKLGQIDPGQLASLNELNPVISKF